MPDQPPPPAWYTIHVSDWDGSPTTVPFRLPADPLPPGLNAAQIRATSVIQDFTHEGNIRELERAIDLCQTGRFPAGSLWQGWSNGGGVGVSVDQQGFVSFGNPSDGMDAKYTEEELGMPLVEFLPFWRDWVASVRSFKALEEKHGGKVPRELWPASYPPRNNA